MHRSSCQGRGEKKCVLIYPNEVFSVLVFAQVLFDKYVLPIKASETFIDTNQREYEESPSRNHNNNLYRRHFERQADEVSWKSPETYVFEVAFECTQEYNPVVLDSLAFVAGKQPYELQNYDFYKDEKYFVRVKEVRKVNQ